MTLSETERHISVHLETERQTQVSFQTKYDSTSTIRVITEVLIEYWVKNYVCNVILKLDFDDKIL